jgi:hypothetical protein
MTVSDKTRIEKEADLFMQVQQVESTTTNKVYRSIYIAGAHAEHPRAWNSALEKVADMLKEGESDHLSSYARRIYIDLAKELESLKIKE